MAIKYPPLLTLEEAVGIVKNIYETHNTEELSKDLLPDILQSKKASSFFPAKISALQKFGLIENLPNGIIRITDIGMAIANPQFPKEEIEAKLKAFKSIDILADLLIKYPNAKLPSLEALKESLIKSFSIERKAVAKWADFVTGSFRVITEISNKTDIVPSTEKYIAEIPKPKTTNYNLPLPSGKSFEFSFEENYTNEDIDFIVSFFELKKQKAKNKGNQ